ncbi:N2,N2-dimethylguanosine tRNA methyltransferase [Paracoccidioides brasiliensis Pb18]|uniref:tRNA (guanine(26)-N(2))-dimethyltransferase n=1 Tax=Paracoccidioides brasiliensis (strain Pb18) TaxID=502780 RepID=C1G063_PARBD|nr:N2,N2-dimethylguanosine tRNA methyltransferase [Paracoccidioides brasiliensis Pb18]EEH43964.1 N2,N2-dimethylguanosine tRNA methyltransferase [Paracoccidioides brasiliensis Pb18]
MAETAEDSSSIPAAVELGAELSAGQIIQHDGKEYQAVKEGLAYILTPRQQREQPNAASSTSTTTASLQAGTGVEGGKPEVDAEPQRQGKKQQRQQQQHQPEVQSVFYNPIQQFNRDLSVLAIRAYGEHAMIVKREKMMRASALKKGMKGKKRKREAEDLGGREEESGEGMEKGQEGDASAGNGVQGSHEPPPPTKNPSFSVLDALSATGLRALRYAKEIPFTTCIVANDLSPDAIKSMKLNIQHNGVGDVVVPNNGDACAYMYSILGGPKPNKDGTHFGRFDVVDLDPYGTAAPFLDAAVQAVTDGGLLCVTCTDASVFASNGYPEKTYALYGGLPFKGPQSHEAGLRLILHAIATSGAKYGLSIEPLLSLSIDFYARVFVRMHRSPASVKFIAGKSMIVYTCDNGCGAWKTQPLATNKRKSDRKGNPFYHYGFAQGPSTTPTCEHCGFKLHLAGPMWGGPLHNNVFIQRILDLLPGADKETYPTKGRIEGMLSTALEEDLDMGGPSQEATPAPEPAAASPSGTNGETNPFTALQEKGSPSLLIPRTDPAKLDPHPFFLMPSYVCKVVHTQTISEDCLRGALHHLGYRSSRSHTKAGSVRTDAPWNVIWEIIREWVRQKFPVKEGKIREGTAGMGIMRRKREIVGGIDGGEDDAGAKLRGLKRDVLAAAEGSREFSDLVMKIEAALYRAGAVSRSAGGDGKSGAEDGGGVHQKEGDAVPQQQQQRQRSYSPGIGGYRRSPSPSRIGPDPSTLNIVFDEALGRTVLAAHRKKRLTRYQMNPRANWGPINRASKGGKS